MKAVATIVRLLWRNGRWAKTLLVLLIALVMIRLGFWQLDRLHQRRARNAAIMAQSAQPPLSLNDPQNDGLWDASPYRLWQAQGYFDFEHQFFLKSQTWKGVVGYHVITPFHLIGRREVVLVDRGWIPYASSFGGSIDPYPYPDHEVTIRGIVGRDALPPRGREGPFLPDPSDRTLYYVDPASLSTVLPYTLLPIYLVWTAAEGEDVQQLPYRPAYSVNLDEGPHLGYAIQWFSFAVIVLGGYVYWLVRQEKESRGK